MLKRSFKVIEENYNSMFTFIREFLHNTDLDNKKKKNLELALEEALLNILHYAYPNNIGDLDIQAVVENEGKVVSFILTDSGIPFNPCNCKEKEPPISIENEEPGNLGIFLMKKMCDICEYERNGNFNILKLSKNV